MNQNKTEIGQTSKNTLHKMKIGLSNELEERKWKRKQMKQNENYHLIITACYQDFMCGALEFEKG